MFFKKYNNKLNKKLIKNFIYNINYFNKVNTFIILSTNFSNTNKT